MDKTCSQARQVDGWMDVSMDNGMIGICVCMCGWVDGSEWSIQAMDGPSQLFKRLDRVLVGHGHALRQWLGMVRMVGTHPSLSGRGEGWELSQALVYLDTNRRMHGGECRAALVNGVGQGSLHLGSGVGSMGG